jgi:ClpP class serine protease
MTLLNALKTLIFLTLILYTAPFLVESIKKQYIAILEPRTPIGVLHIIKPIHSTACLTEQLHSFFRDPTIKGILIKIDCADTAPGTSQTIFHDIRQLKKEYPKPIIALIENMCLSGAYLIASACDSIVAPESAIIGDIGQSFCSWSIKKAVTENSTNGETIENESYQQLTKQIALSRKLSLTTTHNWADGKLFTGTQAIAFGLINEIGSLCTVIKIIKEKALIEGDIEWIEHNEKKQNLLDIFFCNKCAIT